MLLRGGYLEAISEKRTCESGLFACLLLVLFHIHHIDMPYLLAPPILKRPPAYCIIAARAEQEGSISTGRISEGIRDMNRIT